MQTRSRKVAVLLFDEVDALDVVGPLSVLSQAGRHWNWRPFKAMLASRDGGAVVTRDQIELAAGYSFESCPQCDGLLVPGGYGARALLGDERVVSWVGARAAEASWVLSVGWGTTLLAKSGALAGRCVATTPEVAAIVASTDAGATADEASVAYRRSEKFHSAATSYSSIDCALQVVEQVLGKGIAARAARELGHPRASAERIEVLVP
jgi:putative intracellular protease/amidase